MVKEINFEILDSAAQQIEKIVKTLTAIPNRPLRWSKNAVVAAMIGSSQHRAIWLTTMAREAERDSKFRNVGIAITCCDQFCANAL